MEVGCVLHAVTTTVLFSNCSNELILGLPQVLEEHEKIKKRQQEARSQIRLNFGCHSDTDDWEDHCNQYMIWLHSYCAICFLYPDLYRELHAVSPGEIITYTTTYCMPLSYLEFVWRWLIRNILLLLPRNIHSSSSHKILGCLWAKTKCLRCDVETLWVPWPAALFGCTLGIVCRWCKLVGVRPLRSAIYPSLIGYWIVTILIIVPTGGYRRVPMDGFHYRP